MVGFAPGGAPSRIISNMRKYIFFLGLLVSVSISAQDFRYTELVAASSTVTSNVVYGRAPFLNFPYSDENFTTDGDLVMDIYQPTGDGHNLRPVIIFAHAGGFITGNRNHDDMVALCDSFARKGYVTATIDYRQGFYLLNNVPLHGTRAVYRGLQDGRSAVRFLRANATTYGIDPEQVYLGGSSAGSFIALQAIYLSSPDEIPEEVGVQTYTDFIIPRTTPDMGAPDSGDNLSFSGTPNGVIGLWGAVAAPDWVDADDDQPVFLAHGTDDSTVPFDVGPPFGAGNFPDVYGSSVIAGELTTNGTTDFETYFIADAEHEFYGTTNGTWSNGTGPNERWDTLLNMVTPFLWRQHRPEADWSFTTEGLTANLTDDTDGAINQFWDFGDGASGTGPNPEHTYTAPGTYAVRLYVENDLLSYDTLTQQVTVESATLPLNWLGAPRATPAGKDIRLSWEVREMTGVERFVVEHSHTGSNWEPLGMISATYTDPTPLFEYIHLAPAAAAHYYRIRAEDYDGTVYYSPLATLTTDDDALVYPNPTTGEITIEGIADIRNIIAYDAQGGRHLLPVNEGGKLNMGALKAGLYYFTIAGKAYPVQLILPVD